MPNYVSIFLYLNNKISILDKLMRWTFRTVFNWVNTISTIQLIQIKFYYNQNIKITI